MFKLDRLFRVAAASVGALVLSTLTVAAAVGPAHTEPAPVLASVQPGAQAHG